MRNTVRMIVVLYLLVSVAGAFAAEVLEAAADKAIAAGFTELERQLIKKYLGGEETKQIGNSVMVFNNATLKKKQEQALPPGLAKKKDLPPGLAAQLQRNGTLPPGLAKRSLPAELEKQLPPVRVGYERSVLDDWTVVLIEIATNTIVDIILDPVPEANAKPSQKKNEP